MNRLLSKSGPVAVILLASVAVWGVHHELIGNLNDAYLDDWGDAIKNYHSLVYHVQFDSSFSRFEGMNYPFGEQVAFTDGQPALANTIKLVSAVIDISGYTKGIMHGMILAGFVVSGLLVFLILRRKQLPEWYAIPAALAIAFMAPQLNRMGGHFGLAYTFVMPLGWWLALRFDDRPSWPRSAAIGLAVLVVSGLHLYFLALLGMFLTLRWLFQWLQQPDSGRYALHAAKHWAMQVFLPFVVLYSWLRLTDPVRDRPIPSPILGYWEGVFLPMRYPLGQWLDRMVNVRTIDYEGLAYVGLPASLLTIAAVFWWLSRVRPKRPLIRLRAARDPELTASVAAATIMMLFAFGLPFVGPLESLRDFTGPFRQFRALGRFSWAFFYAINVAAFVYFYRRGTSYPAGKALRWVVWLVPIAVLGSEAWYANFRVPLYRLGRIPQLEAMAPPPEWLGAIDPARYQAFIPLPYFRAGGQYLLRWPTEEGLRHTIVTSLLTGLPTTAFYSTRTSSSQTLDALEMVQEPYRLPRLWQKLDPDTPLLIRLEKDQPLTAGERWLLEASVPLYQDDDLQLLEIDLPRWRRRMEISIDSIITAASNTTEDAARFGYRSFDDRKTDLAYRGQGALRSEDGRTQLFTGLVPDQDSVEYVLAAWVHLAGGPLLSQRLHYREQTPDGVLTQERSSMAGELLVVRDEDWGLLEFTFTPTRPDAEQLLYLVVQGRGMPEAWTDEILIRRASEDVVRTAGDEVFVNDRFYHRLTP